ncbi:MAG: hypothetical protein AAB019_09360 [Planctomycetota bacterium]
MVTKKYWVMGLAIMALITLCSVNRIRAAEATGEATAPASPKTASRGGESRSKQGEEALVTVEKLRNDISFLNLINGLNLSETQLKELIAINQEAQTLKEKYKTSYQAFTQEMQSQFNELKTVLSDGPNLPPEIEKRANEINHQAKELKEKLQKELLVYQGKVETILTDAQKKVIEDFTPCLTPPKDQKNPVRVGQAKDNANVVKLLRRIREVPEEVYQEKREKLLAKAFEKFEKNKGPLTAEEKSLEEERLFDLVDEVRLMADEEFEINKEDIAKEFAIKDKAKELENQLKEISEYRYKDKKGLNKIGRFFLNELACPILQERLTKLADFKQAPLINLDELKNN